MAGGIEVCKYDLISQSYCKHLFDNHGNMINMWYKRHSLFMIMHGDEENYIQIARFWTELSKDYLVIFQ